MGYVTFEEWQGSLLEESRVLEQMFAKCGNDSFETRDALCALFKEWISDMNRDEAYRLAGKVDLFDAELKELKIW